ncbi:YgaP family membrane protein [Variovorax paradoxus]|uniref:YgaP family membrane protein n=1 Tax=Variovorax paradoxus TaxID=34073 RepID=UPI00339B243F
MFHLKRNLPAWERVIRLCLGTFAAAGAFYFLPAGTLRLLGFAMVGVLASTAIVGFCPACALLGRKAPGAAK